MADPGPFYAYKETRLNLDPATEHSTISIRLPAHGARNTQKRSQVIEDIPIAEDDDSFRLKHLATAASIYHRTSDSFPRSYLWRVLEGGTVLSIRTIDVSKVVATDDANLTLRLTLPSPIQPGCIAFSDSKDHDVLSAFVYTESKHIITLSLRPDFFRKPASTEDNVGDWCKSYASATFSFKHPHRLVALSANELLFSNHDGSLLKLDRISGGDGADWKETHYSHGGFGSTLRQMISSFRADSIKYRDINMELPTATSIASPSTKIDETNYVFTVSLDHKLRIWNMETGRIAFTVDILNQHNEPPSITKSIIDPSFSQLVKVFSTSQADLSDVCVTYSPLGIGQFKFWSVAVEMGGNITLEDMFPDKALVPRAPSADVWTLADFSVLIDGWNSNSFIVWTLWKNNTTYRVQKLDFHSGARNDIDRAWKDDWKAMATETLAQAPLPTVFQGDPSDGTDKWLEYILFPGRFTRATIETGLSIYNSKKGTTKEKEKSDKSGPLAERMCSTIASVVSLGRASDGGIDYEQFRTATDSQWRRFYRLLVELNKQRGEALSLVIDPRGNMPWVISADGISAIRECSEVERIWHNPDSPPAGTEYVSTLVTAGAAFRETLSGQLLHSCDSAILGELFEEPSYVASMRMRAFYDKSDFANQITDEDYAQLVANLGGGFKNVTLHVYETLVDAMVEIKTDKRPENPLAEFGKKLIVKGIQEIVELHRSICLDQLYLLILIEAEINHGEEGTQFETSQVYNQLLVLLKKLELIAWLARTQIEIPISRVERERSNSLTEKSSNPNKKPSETVTVLEGVLRHLFGFDTRSGVSMSSALTNLIIDTCSPESKSEAPPAVIQCFLLKHDRADLAMQFNQFTEDDAFSTYIQGRVSLASNDPFTAAHLFKKAAFGMAYPDSTKHSEYRSAGFLDETEKRLLNAGLPEYYSHIVYLYDKEKIHSFVIDFTRLALQFIKNEDIQASQLRTEMHSRLFAAAIQTSRYDVAYSALTLLTDTALQLSSLRTLVIKMCEASYASQLIDLPFISLQDHVDEILAQKCQTIVEVNVGVPYHKILYAWRIARSDFRGAATISLERLQRLQQSGEGDRVLGDNDLETPVTKQYIAVINALSCVDPKHAWILSEDLPNKKHGEVKGKRKVVTLMDVRREYQEELDRIAAIENNQFSFAGEDMDVL